LFSDSDIIDNKSILDKILTLDIDKQKALYEFIKKELGGEVDVVKLDSNLAHIINVLSKEDLVIPSGKKNKKSFEIDRKIAHNELKATQTIIEDFSKYHNRVDKIYSDYDEYGNNKSLSILQSIHSSYVEACIPANQLEADEVFLLTIEKVKKKVLESANYGNMPVDELDLCVNILVVDAFIRCNIFKDPEDYQYADS